MKSATGNLIAIVTLGTALAVGNTASAGGIKISIGGGSHPHHQIYHHKVHHYPVKKYYKPVIVVYDRCYHPFYSFCFVYPGDTWYTISKRCYGYGHLWKHIATFNGMSWSNAVLVPGLQLQLPVVNSNGTLGVSNAPAPAPFTLQTFAPQAATVATPVVQPAEASVPAASMRPLADEAKLPAVTLGSTLALDGDSLGIAKGIVRLRIGGMAMPVEVLEWSDSSVKIKLPTMDLAEAMNADLEVLRADGSLASKSAIELTPAATRLALGK